MFHSLLEPAGFDHYVFSDNHEGKVLVIACVALRERKEVPFFSGTGEDRAEGASFWYAFLTPFFGVERIYFFFQKETMLKPMSDLSQIQDEPSKNLD